MPRYFFHADSHTRFRDTEGVELSSLDDARVEAPKTVGDLIREEPRMFWGSRPWSLTVTDGEHLILFTLEIDGQTSPAVRGRIGSKLSPPGTLASGSG
jgi:hypothetical protein